MKLLRKGVFGFVGDDKVRRVWVELFGGIERREGFRGEEWGIGMNV